MKLNKNISDEKFWGMRKDEQAKLARVNCRKCRGRGYYWVSTVYSEQFGEADIVRCSCTKPKVKKG